MLLTFTPKRFEDDRGWFTETFNARRLAPYLGTQQWVQDNQSLSLQAGTVRGLHFQLPPNAQAKLVSCISGAILDVVVDVRAGSPTYGKHISIELSDKNGKHLYIPEGFAHGLMTLEPNTRVAYKVSAFYAPECDAGLRWDDPELGIAWPDLSHPALLSPKDAALPLLSGWKSPFTYNGTPMSLREVA